jgi:hypothetical protein
MKEVDFIDASWGGATVKCVQSVILHERERRMAEREMEVGYRNEACSTTAMNGLCLAITVFVSSKRFCKKLRQQCQIS